MIGPRRTWRARAVRRKAPVEAGSFRRGGACARGGSYGGAHLMSLTAAAVTAAQVTTPSRRSLLCSRRRPWGARSQWAVRPCKGSVLLTAPLGLVHGNHRPAGLVTEAFLTREGTGSMRRYFYRRVRLLGRPLAFRMGLLGWRCARSAQRGVPPSQGASSRPTASDMGGRVGRPRVSHRPFPGWAKGVVVSLVGGGLVGMSALDSVEEAQVGAAGRRGKGPNSDPGRTPLRRGRAAD